jgi:hypothetical protein
MIAFHGTDPPVGRQSKINPSQQPIARTMSQFCTGPKEHLPKENLKAFVGLGY